MTQQNINILTFSTSYGVLTEGHGKYSKEDEHYAELLISPKIP